MLESIKKAFESQQGFEDLSLSRNAWLIHFTTAEAAASIAQQGFQQGSALTGNLGHTSGKQQPTVGVNFAFLVDDDYSIMTLAGFDFGIEVGAAVIFQADAVRMLHATDQFYQAAFWGPSVSSPIHAIYPLESPAFTEPHEWQWAGADGVPMGLFELMDRLVEGQPA